MRKIDVKYWFSIGMTLLVGIIANIKMPLWGTILVAVGSGAILFVLLSIFEWLLKRHKQKQEKNRQKRIEEIKSVINPLEEKIASLAADVDIISKDIEYLKKIPSIQDELFDKILSRENK